MLEDSDSHKYRVISRFSLLLTDRSVVDLGRSRHWALHCEYILVLGAIFTTTQSIDQERNESGGSVSHLRHLHDKWTSPLNTCVAWRDIRVFQ